MKMFLKIIPLSFVALVLGGCNSKGTTADNGGGTGGGSATILPPYSPVIPTAGNCIDNGIPMPDMWPASEHTVDDILPYYTQGDGNTDPNSGHSIYGYLDANGSQNQSLKKITIINNTNGMIYPVISSDNFFKLDRPSSPRPTVVSVQRLYVGKPACNQTGFFLGIPPKTINNKEYNNKAVVYLPRHMWNAGRIEIYTVPPELPTQTTTVNGKEITDTRQWYTVDKVKNVGSVANLNYGNLFYVHEAQSTGDAEYSGQPNNTYPGSNAVDLPLDGPSQLTEYTVQSGLIAEGANPLGSCQQFLFGRLASSAGCNFDQFTVDYDVSTVDTLYAPVAMQQSDGARGWVGSNMKMSDFKQKMDDLVHAKDPTTSPNPDTNMGWPYFYGDRGLNGYTGGFYRVPTGNKIFQSRNEKSRYNPNVNQIIMKNGGAQQYDSSAMNILLIDRYNHWSESNACATDSDPNCPAFKESVNAIQRYIYQACEMSRVIQGKTAAERAAACTYDPNTLPPDQETLMADFLGYNFDAHTIYASNRYIQTGTLNFNCDDTTLTNFKNYILANRSKFPNLSDDDVNALTSCTPGGSYAPPNVVASVPPFSFTPTDDSSPDTQFVKMCLNNATEETSAAKVFKYFPVDTWSTPTGSATGNFPNDSNPFYIAYLNRMKLPDPLGTDLSNCFRDIVKSVLRGTPYPFWNYTDKYYAYGPSSVYNLDPYVWLIHKYLNIASYGFSIDDDLANQQVVGTGISLAVGGAAGLASTNDYKGDNYKQTVALPAGFWTIGSSQNLGYCNAIACDLNMNEGGGFDSLNMTLNGVQSKPSAGKTLTFKAERQPLDMSNPYCPRGYNPIKITQCSINGSPCTPLPADRKDQGDIDGFVEVFVHMSSALKVKPTKDCAQTVTVFGG